jgi:hypothetical protein
VTGAAEHEARWRRAVARGTSGDSRRRTLEERRTLPLIRSGHFPRARAVVGLLIVAAFAFTGCGSAATPAGASGSAAAGQSLPVASPPSIAAATTEVTAAPATVVPATAPPTAAPVKTAAPEPTRNTNPAIVSFDTPKQEDCTNGTSNSIHVSWSVKRATGVTISIDGPGIYDSYDGLTGAVDLPFGCDHTVLKHTYTLTTVGGTGPAATLTKTVRTRAPSIVSFSVAAPDCSGDGMVGVAMSYELRAATGAELWRDGSLYSTYNVKATDDIVLYDCSKDSQAWKLTSTGGYGAPASKTVTVSK